MTDADAGQSPQVPEPRANPYLLGHEHAESRLLEAWTSRRLPHGWLITGPRGIGKATLAFRFARYVLAGGPSAGPDLLGDIPAASLDLDPDHPVFRRVAGGSHADLMTVERGFSTDGKRRRSVIVVDDVRAAGGFLSMTAGEGGWRVVVVDSADEMNPNSANALLKTLEEPPKNTLILLVSHSPSSLAPTIRSRCCRLALAPLSDDHAARLLARYRPELGPEESATLARLAEGSIGRALELAANGGATLHAQIRDLLGAMPRADVATVHQFADLLARREAESVYRASTALLRWWVWQAARCRETPPEEASDRNEDVVCIRHLAGLGSLEQWLEVWDKIGRLFGQADSINLDRKQVILNAFHHISRVAAA